MQGIQYRIEGQLDHTVFTQWTEGPDGLQSMGSHRVRQDLATKATVIYKVLFTYRRRINERSEEDTELV